MPSRRRFLAGLAGIAAATGCLTTPVRKVDAPAEGPLELDVDEVEAQLRTEQSDALELHLEGRGTRVLLLRDASAEAGFVALDTACTHLGCGVRVSGEALTCPCHGSVFSRTGEVRRGPASQPLARFGVERKAGRLLLVLSAMAVLTFGLGSQVAHAQSIGEDEAQARETLTADDVANSDVPEARPFVRGGIDDKPFITELFGTRVGGYGDVHFRYEETEGATEALTFVPERFNLFTYTPVGERVRVATELEIEEGGEEIKLELAIIDFEIHPSLIFRGGILLAPLGRFNLAHDGPANDLTDRPLVSTELLGVTLSEVGMGFYGTFTPYADGRITYEIYAVNGLTDGVIVGSGDGTRVPAGKGNFEDADHMPSGVARVAFSPVRMLEVGLSGHVGPYNRVAADGFELDERRLIGIAAVDWQVDWWIFALLGEYAWIHVDLPEALEGLFASQQQGTYVELQAHFLEGVFTALPESLFGVAARFGYVDFDMGLAGDSVTRLTAGAHFRPQAETIFKLDYQYDWQTDPFEVTVNRAAVLFSVASYF